MDEQQQNPTPAPAETADATQPDTEPGAAASAPDYQAQAAENLAGWQRALADYANLKREAERGAAEIGKYASAGVVTALLPVLDSFAKAHAAYPADGDAAALAKWADGIGHIKAQLDAALGKMGLVMIDTAGVPFDPAQHEAMMMQPATPEAPSGTVMKILDPGYKMHDRVLRAAKVVVAE